jgi:hypothetical protein
MFKITQNTVHRFSLAEVLLMIAINQVHQNGMAAGSNNELANSQAGQ